MAAAPAAGGSRATYDKAQENAHSKKFDDRAGSRRILKYGKAFQNYRCTILHRLKQAVDKRKQAFLSAADAAAGDGKVAASVANAEPGEHQQTVWTTEDMEEFLDTQVTYEAQVEHQQKVIAERKDPSHPDHGKPMPMTTRPMPRTPTACEPPPRSFPWQAGCAARH